MTTLKSPVLPVFPPQVTVGGIPIGPGHPCFIIAEAGSNHDRRLEKALALVDAAADAGCHAVKFQTFQGPDLASTYDGPEVRLPDQYRRWGNNLQEFFQNHALPDHFHEPLMEHARARGILFLSSPFSEQAVDRLHRLGVAALKIASFELGHIPLIRHAAQTGLPLILSTGMAGLGDVERALDAAYAHGCRELVLLHCGSNYPFSVDGAHLAVMETMRRAFGVPVGYSDHTDGVAIPVAAAALGANALEKHFTLAERGEGADHQSFALDPTDLQRLVREMDMARRAVGLPSKRRQPEEEENARRGRRAVYAVRALPAGHTLAPTDIKVVRPGGSGLDPGFLDLLFGRKLVQPVQEDRPLTWDHFLARDA